MNNSNLTIDTELLVSYAYGLLAPELASRVKSALEDDEMLRGEYEGIVYLMKTYPDEDPTDILEEMVAEIDHKLDVSIAAKKKDSLPLWRWKPIAVAASVLLIVTLGIFTWTNRRSDPVLIASEIVKEKYHNSVDDERNEMERGETVRGEIERGEIDTSWQADFDEGNYPVAIRKLSALSDSSLSSREELYFGLCYLKAPKQQIDLAEKHLQKSASLPGLYQNDALYYLGVVRLLKRDVEGAKKYLNKAGSPPADKLLEQLPR